MSLPDSPGLEPAKPRFALIRLRRHFDAAHQLPYHQGKCANLHGHRFTAEIALSGRIREPVYPLDMAHQSPDCGMVVDFAEVKQWWDSLLPDHKTLNAMPAADRSWPPHTHLVGPESLWKWNGRVIGLDNPTAENLAWELWEFAKRRWPMVQGHPQPHAVYVRVWETPDADVTVGLNAHPNAHP